MNARELTQLLSSNIHTRRIFRGVFARDQLKSLDKLPSSQPSAFVINCCPLKLPGQHWMALFIHRQKAIYFDSFGIPPFHPDIESFIKKNATKVIYNKRLLQDITSDACGFYVMYFIYQKSRGVSLPQLLQPFNTNTQTNDRKLYHRIKQIFKTKRKIQFIQD